MQEIETENHICLQEYKMFQPNDGVKEQCTSVQGTKVIHSSDIARYQISNDNMKSASSHRINSRQHLQHGAATQHQLQPTTSFSSNSRDNIQHINIVENISNLTNASFATFPSPEIASQRTATTISNVRHSNHYDTVTSHGSFDPAQLPQMPPADEFKKMYKHLLVLQDRQQKQKEAQSKKKMRNTPTGGVSSRQHVDAQPVVRACDGSSEPKQPKRKHFQHMHHGRDTYLVDYNDNDNDEGYAKQQDQDPDVYAATVAALQCRSQMKHGGSFSPCNSTPKNARCNETKNNTKINVTTIMKSILHSYSLLLSLAGGNGAAVEVDSADTAAHRRTHAIGQQSTNGSELPQRHTHSSFSTNADNVPTQSFNTNNTHDDLNNLPTRHEQQREIHHSEDVIPAVSNQPHDEDGYIIPMHGAHPRDNHNRSRTTLVGGDMGDRSEVCKSNTNSTKLNGGHKHCRLQKYKRYLSLLPSPIIGVAFAVVLVVFTVLMTTQ